MMTLRSKRPNGGIGRAPQAEKAAGKCSKREFGGIKKCQEFWRPEIEEG